MLRVRQIAAGMAGRAMAPLLKDLLLPRKGRKVDSPNRGGGTCPCLLQASEFSIFTSFAAQRGGSITEFGVQKVIREPAATPGLEFPIHPHTCCDTRQTITWRTVAVGAKQCSNMKGCFPGAATGAQGRLRPVFHLNCRR